MAKKKQPPRRHSREHAAPVDPRQAGLRAFESGRLDEAIAGWSRLAPRDPQVAAALAEALFRRAAHGEDATSRLADLRRAVELAPNDLRYRYHLGLAYHRTGNLDAAITCYRAVLAHDPAWHGAGHVLALAMLEQNPTADLAALPGASPSIARLLAPAQALLVGRPLPPLGDTAPERFWQGLAALQQGGTGAGPALADDAPITPGAALIRTYYHGVAAATEGDIEAAFHSWQAALLGGYSAPWLGDNLAAALARRIVALDKAGDLAGAVAIAELPATQTGQNNALASLAVATLDRAAQAAAATTDWPRATALWEMARATVSAVPALGSPRIFWHNLALGYEAQERWREAADAWRGLLRTRPRGRAVPEPAPSPDDASALQKAGNADVGGLSEAQWAWARRRVIECYKRAGEPGAAVEIYRQAIKSDPGDTQLRLELADALLANDQQQAALNELNRVLERDRGNVDARLRLASLEAENGHWHAAGTLFREVLAEHPERDDARKQLAQTVLDEGRYWHDLGRLEQAAARFAEGQQLAPDDPEFPLALARVAIDDEQRTEAAAHLARALEIGGDRPSVYVMALECWGVLNEFDEARRVLARAETALPLASAFFVEAGRVLLTDRRVGSPVLGKARPADKPGNSRWETLARELLDRAVQLRPNDTSVYSDITGALVATRPDIALPYAAEGVRVDPEDPTLLEQLGMVQAAAGQRGPAKQTLRQAARLARRQGDGELGREIEEISQMVDSPFLTMLLKTALSGGLEGLDDLFG